MDISAMFPSTNLPDPLQLYSLFRQCASITPGTHPHGWALARYAYVRRFSSGILLFSPGGNRNPALVGMCACNTFASDFDRYLVVYWKEKQVFSLALPLMDSRLSTGNWREEAGPNRAFLVTENDG